MTSFLDLSLEGAKKIETRHTLVTRIHTFVYQEVYTASELRDQYSVDSRTALYLPAELLDQRRLTVVDLTRNICRQVEKEYLDHGTVVLGRDVWYWILHQPTSTILGGPSSLTISFRGQISDRNWFLRHLSYFWLTR